MTKLLSSDSTVDACTLPAAERPLRVAEFETLFRTSLRTLDRVDETQVRMTLSGDGALLPVVRDLTARESECCSFFRFTITELGPHDLELGVAVSPAHVDVLDGLARLASSAAGLSA